LVAAAHQSLWHPDYRPSLFTTVLLNSFAFAFSLADRYVEAERCYLELGDHRVTNRPWDEHDDGPKIGFVTWRDYVFGSLEYERNRSGSRSSH
jgi:hypothetical protein